MVCWLIIIEEIQGKDLEGRAQLSRTTEECYLLALSACSLRSQHHLLMG